MSKGWRKLVAAVLALGGLVVVIILLPVSSWLVSLVGWIHGQGPAGPVLFAAAYVLAAVFLLPGSVLTLGGGFVFGPLWGLALVSPVSVVAATVAFGLARTVARSWIMKRFGQDPRLAKIDAAVARNGFKIVLLLRLSPLFPYNALNYLLGLTRVRTRDFILASWIGMLPATALYVYIGSLVTTASELSSELSSGSRPSTGTAGKALLAVGLAATLAVTLVVTRIARRALKSELQESAAPKEQAKQ